MEYGSQVLFLLTIAYILRGIYYTSASFVTTTQEHNIKAGLVGVALVFIAQSSLKPYKSPFRRVRDAFWRVWSRIGLLYIGLMVFLLFQRAEDARFLFSYIDPNLGKELAIRTEIYDRNCELSYENVMKLTDFYFIAHFLNWFFAALIVRDSLMLHIWSVLDEVIELSLKNIRPNFSECWWDSLFLDIIIANTLGIIIGMWLIRLTNTLEYDWFGRKEAKSCKDWKCWTQHRYYQGITLLLVFVSLNFVTGFTVSNSLWIPPSHWVLIVRLLIWLFQGVLGFREGYDDIVTWGTAERGKVIILAQHRWQAWLMLFCETMLSWKFRERAGNNLDAIVPPYVVLPWLLAFVCGTLYYVYLRFIYKYRLYKDGRLMDVSVALEQKKQK